MDAKVWLEALRIAPLNFKSQFCIDSSACYSRDFGGGNRRAADCIFLLVWRKMSISHRRLDSLMIRHRGSGREDLQQAFTRRTATVIITGRLSVEVVQFLRCSKLRVDDEP